MDVDFVGLRRLRDAVKVLKFDRRLVANRGVKPDGVVEAVDVVADGVVRLGRGGAVPTVGRDSHLAAYGPAYSSLAKFWGSGEACALTASVVPRRTSMPPVMEKSQRAFADSPATPPRPS